MHASIVSQTRFNQSHSTIHNYMIARCEDSIMQFLQLENFTSFESITANTERQLCTVTEGIPNSNK